MEDSNWRLLLVTRKPRNIYRERGSTRRFIPAGTIVTSGSTYTFTYTTKTPITACKYYTQYRMVRDGVAGYGDTVSKSITVS